MSKSNNNKLEKLYKERDVLQEKLNSINLQIIQIKTKCEYENTELCEFIKKNASYVCKICKKHIMHR